MGTDAIDILTGSNRRCHHCVEDMRRQEYLHQDAVDRSILVQPHQQRLYFIGCTGYLVHPFKNKHAQTEKELHSLLANTGGLV